MTALMKDCGSNSHKELLSYSCTLNESRTCCLCFYIFKRHDPVTGISPGLGCDDALVTEIVAELQKRKEQRGGIAQMRKLDFLVNKVTSVAQQITATLQKVGTQYEPIHPPQHESPMTFTKMLFDVTPICGKMSCTQQMLQLEEEEAILTTNTLFGFESRVQKRNLVLLLINLSSGDASVMSLLSLVLLLGQ